MTILSQALELATNQQGIATKAMEGLHKMQNLILSAKSECRSVNDHENALRLMWNELNSTLIGIDEMVNGAPPKAPIDHTDLTQDVVGINPLS